MRLMQSKKETENITEIFQKNYLVHGGETHWAFVPDFVANAGQKTGCLFSCWTKIVYRQVKTGCLKLEKNKKNKIHLFF
jgi:hypothetical protein